MELIDDSDGYFSGFIVELAEPLEKATRRANLSVVERERLVRRLAKVADHLKDYEMHDVVEDALAAASGAHNVATRDDRQHRKTKLKHK